VQVQVRVAPELPWVEGDEDLLHRAVFNLVLNAIQAVGDVGHVFIEVDRYHPSGEHGPSSMLTGELLSVSVTDDGPGVPPDLADRLFEPFVTGKLGGTGLGLPVVHRAVEAHRGVVLVDALPQGTRFTMVLPIGRAAETLLPPTSPSGVSA
jgi:signal transduction histidine kinase